ncbi:acetylornithine transaminase [Carnobacterium gallinarum]|uniref:acetylornithine transaminase n=1 Tax=Carnobacterium gallinarum TaxID=2749 RepID=UPI000559917C|nr:acetylornithine transaminase [Carnobacterium gallinarum]
MSSALFPTYARNSLELVRGSGSIVVDAQGKQYLDYTAGIAVCNLGHSHPRLNAILQQQSEAIWHTSNLYENSLQEKVAKQLGGSDYLAFFANSGAEANEAAIKLARKHTGKDKIITCLASFHGRTFATMSATGQRKIHDGFGSLLPTFDYVPFNDFEALVAVADNQTAAIMLELVQGEGGVIPANQDYIAKVADFCNEHQILLIVDEVQTGIGRTGSLFCGEIYGIQPDIITVAKGLGNGFPVGAMLGKKKFASSFGAGSHGSTFGGNKLAMSVANETLKIIQEPNFLNEVKEKATYLQQLLKVELKQKQQVVAIRGLGFLLGIELIDPVAPLIVKLQEKGVLILSAGPNVMRILPPLTTTKEEIQLAVKLISEEIN